MNTLSSTEKETELTNALRIIARGGVSDDVMQMIACDTLEKCGIEAIKNVELKQSLI